MVHSPFKAARILKTRSAGIAALLVLLIFILYRILTGGLHFFEQPASITELEGVRLPQYTALTPSFLNSLWPLLLLAFVLSLITLRLAQVMSRARVGNHLRDESNQNGTAAVEFVLVFPALTALLLMILQIALMVQAKFVVNYAAFCAARSAIVVIPDEVRGDGNTMSEPRNLLVVPDRSSKTETIRRAAALPMTAISPVPGMSLARGGPVITDTEPGIELAVLLLPFNVGPVGLEGTVGQVSQRAPYAYDGQNTQVKVLTTQGAEGGSFKDHDWVTVKVSYRYYLTVPFAKKLFGTPYSGSPIVNIIFGTDYFYEIVEEYSLPMDGEPNGL